MKNLVLVLFVAFILGACSTSDNRTVLNEPKKTESLSDAALNDAPVLITDEQTNEMQVEPLEASSDFTRNFDNHSAKISFYERCAKKTQRYTIDPAKDVLLVCNEGTTLWIDANSFCSATDGSVITTPVVVKVKEFYDISDILMAKLSTRSDNQLLETGGMLQIEAVTEGKPCELKEGSFIEIGMPTKNKKEDMQLFSGTWNDEGQINWQVQEDTRDLNGIVAVVDTLARFYASEGEIKSQIRQAMDANRIHAPWSEAEFAQIECIVERDGKITEAKVLKCSDEEYGRVAAEAIQKFSMRPAIYKGEPVNSRMTIPISQGVVSSNPYDVCNYDGNSLYKHRSASGGYLSNTTRAMNINNYLFRSNRMGWINCDRFLDVPKDEQTDYFVYLDNPLGVEANLVFKKMRAIVKGDVTAEGIVFRNVPINEPVQLVVIKFEQSVPYLAISKTTTSSVYNSKLDFEEVNDDMLFAKLEEFK